jgi:hypothetical protein
MRNISTTAPTAQQALAGGLKRVPCNAKQQTACRHSRRPQRQHTPHKRQHTPHKLQHSPPSYRAHH